MTNGELSKTPSNVWQKLKWSHKEGNLAKWQLYENGKFRQKCQISAEMASKPSILKRFGQISREMWKRGILTTNSGFYEMTNLARVLQKVWQKWNPYEKNKYVDNCESYENDKLRNWPVWQGFIEGLTKK